jgi:hypothetical protein
MVRNSIACNSHHCLSNFILKFQLLRISSSTVEKRILLQMRLCIVARLDFVHGHLKVYFGHPTRIQDNLITFLPSIRWFTQVMKMVNRPKYMKINTLENFIT